MSEGSIKILRCDRCTHKEEIRLAHMEYEWSKVRVRQTNGPFAIGHGDGCEDICPACSKELKEWWDAKKEEREVLRTKRRQPNIRSVS